MAALSEGDKKYYRILNILNRLNSGSVNTTELAEEFNVSPRSVQRDIERINMTGFSLVCEKRGTYSFAPGISLKSMRLTEEQIYVLIMMRDKLSSLGGPVSESFDSIFARIVSGTDADPLFYDINTKGLTPLVKDIYSDISYAVRSRKYIRILYPGRNGLKEYVLKPLKILTSDTFFYVLAVPTKKEVLLKYRIDRIKKLDVLIEEYRMPENPDILESLKNATSVWGVNTKEKFSVILEVCGQAADFFRCKTVLPDQKIQEKKDGILTVSARISHEMEIFPLILQWLPEIKLVSPEILRLKLKEKMLQVRSYLKTEFDI